MIANRGLFWAASGLGAAAVVVAAFVLWRNFPLAWPGAPVVETPAPAGASNPPETAAPAKSEPTKTATSAEPSRTANPAPVAGPAPQAAATPAPPPQPASVAPSQPAVPAANGPSPGAQRPSFDVVSVEPSGDTVVAGRAAPKAAVELRADGKVIALTNADETGQFAMVPPPLTPGAHRLELASRLGEAPSVLSDAVPVEVPKPAIEAPAPAAPSAPPRRPAAVAAEAPAVAPAPSPAPAHAPAPAPPSASVHISAPTPAPSPVAVRPPSPEARPSAGSANALASASNAAPAAVTPAPPQAAPKIDGPKVAAVAAASPTPLVWVQSVAATEAGRLEVKGGADPNALVRLYLNGVFLADATAAADGRWSLTVERGMAPGNYVVRADVVEPGASAVTARAEVRFTYPKTPSEGESVLAATPQPAAGAPAGPAPAPAAAAAAKAPANEAPAPKPVAEATPAVKVEPAPRAGEETAKPEAATALTGQTNGQDGAASLTPAAGEPAKFAEASSANPVVTEIHIDKVVRGDSLWAISRHFYGHGVRYGEIFEANGSQIRNPKLIYPGQIFVVPDDSATP